jgi:hypothetical protein
MIFTNGRDVAAITSLVRARALQSSLKFTREVRSGFEEN